MATRYLLRHCQYANPRNIIVGRLPVVLSPEGEIEAGRLRTYFADKSIGRIYSSAVERCKQTATIVADKKTEIIYDQRILEGLSAFQGYWVDRKPPWFDYYSHTSELGGENFGEIQRRMVDFWQSLNEVNENIIICSHGDPLFSLYAYLMKIEISTDEQAAYQRSDYIPKGAFWQFEGEGDTWKLISMKTQDDLMS